MTEAPPQVAGQSTPEPRPGYAPLSSIPVPPSAGGSGSPAGGQQLATRLRRFLPRTLTDRLVTGVVALVVIVVVVLGSSTYLLLRAFVFDRFDRQLTSTTQQNATAISDNINGNNYLISPGQRMWVILLGPDGSVPPTLSINGNPSQVAPLELPLDQRLDFVQHPGRIREITSSDNASLRAESAKLEDGSVVVIGLSTAEPDRTLERLLVLEIAIGAAAVALSALLTWWGVRAGLSPLYRVTRTAQEVTAELGPEGSGLDRRVPDADPATEVGKVASSLNTLLAAVETEFAARLRSEERMRQFLADASHELRTPLTSIRGYAELSRLKGQSTNDTEDPMRRIEVEGTRMSRLVDDLLLLARGDDRSRAVSSAPIDVDELLRDALGAVRSAHPDREFALIASGGAEILGDRDELRRLLLNLLNNAALHTQPGGPIRLEAQQLHQPGASWLRLRVIDSGPGLSPEEAAHVFERFWRADKARSRARGGSGLGMAIVAQIAGEHGGSVAFDSDVQVGTTVTVTLPASSSGRRDYRPQG